MIILQVILTAFTPAHRLAPPPKPQPAEVEKEQALDVDALVPCADELVRDTREHTERATCELLATAERILLGRPARKLNGHGEYRATPLNKPIGPLT